MGHSKPPIETEAKEVRDTSSQEPPLPVQEGNNEEMEDTVQSTPAENIPIKSNDEEASALSLHSKPLIETEAKEVRDTSSQEPPLPVQEGNNEEMEDTVQSTPAENTPIKSNDEEASALSLHSKPPIETEAKEVRDTSSQEPPLPVQEGINEEMEETLQSTPAENIAIKSNDEEVK